MAVLAVLENTLPSFCWSYKVQDKEATVLKALAALALMAVSVVTATPARNHFSLSFCHCFGCGSDAVRMWFGRGSDVVRMWFGRGSDVVRMWVGGGSDVLSDLVQTVWQKLRESGCQQLPPLNSNPPCSVIPSNDQCRYLMYSIFLS